MHTVRYILISLTRIITISVLLICAVNLVGCGEKKAVPQSEIAAPVQTKTEAYTWIAPDTAGLGNSENDELIKYGKKLIENTGFYLGPNGTVAHIANGMNCQNCHLSAGTKVLGNNYSAVAANYPKFRERSGSVETIYKRVNDCMERSLNGRALDPLSREMQALKAYISWVGKDVPKGIKPKGSGLTELAYLDQAADPELGKAIYQAKCISCHGDNGQGKLNTDIITYQYPPLWGPHSYTMAAGLFRLSRLAGYVKSNMPFGVDYTNPQLSDEDAWNVAAYVNSQPRPTKDISKDWPVMASKPVDHPFGPYVDSFTEKQHKYGPFAPIAAFKKARQNNK